MGLPCLKNARRIFAIVSTTSIPTSASKNHGSQCGPSVPGSRLEADHPEKGVLFACRFTQQIHGSKRSLRSVEDFTEFEQRTAYFNGDAIHAIKKGMNILDRIQVSHMAQMQNMFDFPPAPKLTALGRLDPKKATRSELRGEKLFFGK